MAQTELGEVKGALRGESNAKQPKPRSTPTAAALLTNRRRNGAEGICAARWWSSATQGAEHEAEGAETRSSQPNLAHSPLARSCKSRAIQIVTQCKAALPNAPRRTNPASSSLTCPAQCTAAPSLVSPPSCELECELE